MKIRVTMLILVLAASCPAFAFNAKETYSRQCSGCHGAKGKGNAGFSPRLAGQYWQYSRDQIRDIKLGKRTNGGSAMMRGLFSGMAAADIEAMARYLEKLR